MDYLILACLYMAGWQWLFIGFKALDNLFDIQKKQKSRMAELEASKQDLIKFIYGSDMA